MKQISSDFTPLLQYVLPWTIIIMFTIGTIAAFVEGQFSVAFGAMIVGTVVVGFMRTMFMDLKKVLLDTENRLMIVKGRTEESIPYADIHEILRPWTPPYIATVTLNKDYSFGKIFTFVPDGHLISWDNYDEDLKKKIRK